MNRGEIVVKFVIQLVFKLVSGIAVYFIAKHLLNAVSWQTVLALFIATSTAARAKVTFEQAKKSVVPDLSTVVHVKTEAEVRNEQAIAIRNKFRNGTLDKIAAIKEIRNLFNHTSDIRGFLKEAKAYIEGDL